MTCSRCCGLIVDAQMFDLEGVYGEMWSTSRRCVNCGHVYDPVIEQHHLAHPRQVLVPSSGEPDHQDDEVHLGAESFIMLAA